MMLADSNPAERYGFAGVPRSGGGRRSRILGGGALNMGAPCRALLGSIRDSGLDRSGELFPFLMLDSGARAGIRDGLPLVFVAVGPLAWFVLVIVTGAAVGVFAPLLAPDLKFPTLLALLSAADFDVLGAVDPGPGVFDLGPGTCFVSSSSITSR